MQYLGLSSAQKHDIGYDLILLKGTAVTFFVFISRNMSQSVFYGGAVLLTTSCEVRLREVFWARFALSYNYFCLIGTFSLIFVILTIWVNDSEPHCSISFICIVALNCTCTYLLKGACHGLYVSASLLQSHILWSIAGYLRDLLKGKSILM